MPPTNPSSRVEQLNRQLQQHQQTERREGEEEKDADLANLLLLRGCEPLVVVSSVAAAVPVLVHVGVWVERESIEVSLQVSHRGDWASGGERLDDEGGGGRRWEGEVVNRLDVSRKGAEGVGERVVSRKGSSRQGPGSRGASPNSR